MKEKISIIIPIYNVEKYIAESLNSVLNQTYKNLEIICVNDGSPDNSKAIVEEVQKLDERVILINKPNGGLSSARNSGLKKVSGDYVCFLDSDDLIHPTFIETMLNQIKKHNADMVSCNFFKFKDGKSFKWNNQTKINEEVLTPKDYIKRSLTGKTLQGCVAWGKLYKKDSIKTEFFEDVKYGEDMPFNYFCAKTMEKIVWIDSKLVAYRQRKNSLVHQKFNTNKLTALNGEELIKRDCEIWDPSLVPYAKLWLYFQHFELLFFMYNSKFSDCEIISNSISFLKENSKHLKSNKKASLFRRIFAPLGQFLLITLSKRHIRKVNKLIKNAT